MRPYHASSRALMYVGLVAVCFAVSLRYWPAIVGFGIGVTLEALFSKKSEP